MNSRVHRSSFNIHHSRKGFTLIEMFTTVAAMFIVLGLLVSLARNVRASSADDLTRRILRELNQTMLRYLEENPDFLTNPAPGLAVDVTDERQTARFAERSGPLAIVMLRNAKMVSSDFLAGLPEWIYDGTSIRDAWGSPIAFLPVMHPRIGMAPENRPFFFSAGPDRKYLTREDNLYSYEQTAVVTKRITNPAGQRE